jgi:hypothetical protein
MGGGGGYYAQSLEAVAILKLRIKPRFMGYGSGVANVSLMQIQGMP